MQSRAGVLTDNPSRPQNHADTVIPASVDRLKIELALEFGHEKTPLFVGCLIRFAFGVTSTVPPLYHSLRAFWLQWLESTP